jgi:hypothetical protein
MNGYVLRETVNMGLTRRKEETKNSFSVYNLSPFTIILA